MQDFDLRPQRVPFDFLDGIPARLDREIGEELPLDLLSPFRRSPLLSMDHGQSECGKFLLLADRRRNPKLAETNFETLFVRVASVILDLDPMQAFDRNLVHFVGSCMNAVPGKPINTGSHKEMRSNLLGQAKQFVDVALAIANTREDWSIAVNSPASGCSPSARSEHASD